MKFAIALAINVVLCTLAVGCGPFTVPENQVPGASMGDVGGGPLPDATRDAATPQDAGKDVGTSDGPAADRASTDQGLPPAEAGVQPGDGSAVEIEDDAGLGPPDRIEKDAAIQNDATTGEKDATPTTDLGADAAFADHPTQCNDLCQKGETRCETQTRSNSCADYNGDGCMEWGLPTDCTAGTLCYETKCVKPEERPSDVGNACSPGCKELCIHFPSTSDSYCTMSCDAVACPNGSICKQGHTGGTTTSKVCLLPCNVPGCTIGCHQGVCIPSQGYIVCHDNTECDSGYKCDTIKGYCGK